ncbi:MAG: hypothetical protein ACRENP_06415 [Longimicrobiales bacterium]
MGYYRHRPYDRQMEAELGSLEEKAEGVRVPGADAPFYNAAGDLCSEAKDDLRALDYYGKAVDAYLKAERWEAAAAMCRKILRSQPEAVRARCTLSWLAIGKGFVADAQTQVTEYAAAAYRVGRELLAASQLSRMGELAVNSTVRVTVAEQLLTLGADRAADHLFGAVLREHNLGRWKARDVNWTLVRRAALLGPKDLDSRELMALRRTLAE